MDTNYQGSLKKKTDNLKIPLPVKEIRFVDRNLTTQKNQNQNSKSDGFSVNSPKHFRKK